MWKNLKILSIMNKKIINMIEKFPPIIPVFPLSGVIYFPKTNLPLNIYTAQNKSNKNFGKKRGRKRLKATYSFAGLEEMTQGLSEEETINKLAEFLFAVPLQMHPTVLKKFISADNQKEFVRQACVRLMSLPEYQMC